MINLVHREEVREENEVGDEAEVRERVLEDVLSGLSGFESCAAENVGRDGQSRNQEDTLCGTLKVVRLVESQIDSV